jgi:hypothetical protein
MIAFENYLIDKGFEKYAWNTNKAEYYKPKTHIISTMVNICHIYIKGDLKIVVGLHEVGKPVTLVNPRPRILIEKIVEDKIIKMSEYEDDSMNIILQKFSFDEIFEAMYDKEKILYYKIN